MSSSFGVRSTHYKATHQHKHPCDMLRTDTREHNPSLSDKNTKSFSSAFLNAAPFVAFDFASILEFSQRLYFTISRVIRGRIFSEKNFLSKLATTVGRKSPEISLQESQSEMILWQ